MDYGPNKKREKQEKNIQKVVKGNVRTKKKTMLRKIADGFISEDAKNVDERLADVFIRSIKKMLSEMGKTAIDMIFDVEPERSKGRGESFRVDYGNRYNDRRREPRTRTNYNYDDIVLDTRSEAMEVLNHMDDLIDVYGAVSVADLFDLVGVSANYTDNKYGWTNLRNAEVERIRDGYLLKLPKAIPID